MYRMEGLLRFLNPGCVSLFLDAARLGEPGVDYLWIAASAPKLGLYYVLPPQVDARVRTFTKVDCLPCLGPRAADIEMSAALLGFNVG